MSFWDAKALEEQKKKRLAEELKKKRLADEKASKLKALLKIKKRKALDAKWRQEEEEAEKTRRQLLGEEAEGAQKEGVEPKKEPFVPPVLNRGFGFGSAGGAKALNSAAQEQLKKNQLAMQKKAAEEDSAGGKNSEAFDGPKLTRPF